MVDEDRLNKLKDILEKNPDSPLFTQYADLLRKANRIDEAITILENGIRKHPNNSTAYLILGRCFNDKGAMEAAIQNYEHASELDPQNILAHKELGNAYISVGEKSKALIIFNKVFKMDNSDMEVKKIIDELSTEESKKAVDEDIGSMTEKGDFFSFFDNSVNIEKSKPIEKSEETQFEVSDKTPKIEKPERPEWLTVEIAKIYIKHNFKDKAIDVLKRLKEFEPENQEAIELLKELGVIEEVPKWEEKPEPPPETSASQEFTETFGQEKESVPEEKELIKEKKHPSNAVSLDALFGDKEESLKPPSEPPEPKKKDIEETKDIGQFKSWLNNIERGK